MNLRLTPFSRQNFYDSTGPNTAVFAAARAGLNGSFKGSRKRGLERVAKSRSTEGVEPTLFESYLLTTSGKPHLTLPPKPTLADCMHVHRCLIKLESGDRQYVVLKEIDASLSGIYRRCQHPQDPLGAARSRVRLGDLAELAVEWDRMSANVARRRRPDDKVRTQ